MRVAPLRVAVAGSGYFARFHHASWARVPQADLVATASLDADSLAAVSNEFGTRPFDDVATMLDAERPDLLDIVTPPAAHLPLIRLAAERGIDVQCQKPFCGGLDGAREAVSIAAQAGIRLVVHENVRWQPWYAAIRQTIAAGRLGAPMSAAFRLRPGDGRGADAYRSRQPYFRAMPRFLVHETGVHWIDTFRYLFGEPDWVFADLRRLNPHIVGEDAGTVLMGHGSTRTLFDGNRLADHAAANPRLTLGEMTVEGEDATLTLDGAANLLLRPHGALDAERVPFAWRDEAFGGDCVHRLHAALAPALIDGTPFPNEGAAYSRNLEVVEAAYRSHAERRVVALDPAMSEDVTSAAPNA